MNRTIHYLMISALVLMLICCGERVTENMPGSETTNGLTVLARYANGNPATGARVRVRQADYMAWLPTSQQDSTNKIDSVTDSNGRCAVHGLQPGDYRIEINDITTRTAVMLSGQIGERDTLNLGTAELMPTASIQGAIDIENMSQNHVVLIQGLERVVQVDSLGRYSFTDLPQGNFNIMVVSIDSNNSPTLLADARAITEDTTIVASPLPTPWLGTSVGMESPVGGAMYAEGQFTVTGGGPDIWDKGDGFNFVYRPWSGDGEIVTRVAYFEYTKAFSKAGVMFRQSLDSNSIHVAASLEQDRNANNIFCIHHRLSSTDTSQILASITSFYAPQWIRLARSGDVFTASVSPDSINWTIAGSDTVPMSQDVLVGLAVTSQDTTRLSTAIFENVIVQ